MALTIPQFKKQYPQYKDIPDEELAEKFYNKYYKGKISIEDFKNKVLPTAEQKAGMEETDIFSAGEGVAGTPTEFQFGRDEAGELENYLNSDDFQRLAVEVFGAVGGIVTAGTLTTARTAIGGLLRARPLLTRSLFAGTGESLGAGASQTFDPKESVIREMLRGFATGASAEVIGAAIPRILGKVGFKGIKFTDEAEKAEELIKSQKDKVNKGYYKLSEEEQKIANTGMITPGIGSENRFIDVAENVAEKSLIGGGRILQSRRGAELLSTKSVDDFLEQYGKDLSREDYGSLITRAIENNLDAFKAQSNKLYQKVNELTKPVYKKTIQEVGKKPTGVVDNLGNPVYKTETKTVNEIVEGGVDITSSKQIARKLIAEAKPVAKLQVPALRVANSILDNADKVDFATANTIRSTLLGINRSSTELVGGQAQRYAANIANELTKNIDQANVSPVARDAYNKAQSFYKNNVKKYNDRLIKRLIDKDSEIVYKTLVAPGRPSTVNRLSKIIKDTKDVDDKIALQSKLKGTLLQDIAKISEKKGKLDGATLLKEFNKFGDDVLEKIFSKQEISTIRSLFKSLETSQKKAVGEGIPGAIFIQLSQAGAVLGLLTGTFAAQSAAILLAPIAIARAFTNPKIVGFLKKGFNLKPDSDAAIKNFTRLISYMASVNIISDDDADDVIESLKP